MSMIDGELLLPENVTANNTIVLEDLPTDDAATYIPVEVVAGIGLMVMQTVFSISGITLQRLAHVREQEVARGIIKLKDLSFRKTPRMMWWTGITMYIGCQFIMPFALALAPMSLLAPLSCVSIIINLTMAYTVLHEEITRRDLFFTLAAGAFASGVLIFGPKSEVPEHLAFFTEIAGQMRLWGLIFCSCVLATTFICLYFYKFRAGTNWNRTKYFIVPWLHTSLAAFGLIFTKGLGTQVLRLKEAFDNGNVAEPMMKLIVTALFITLCSPLSAYFQVIATTEFDQRWFVPVEFSLSVVLGLFMGAATFNEWDELPPYRIGAFLIFSSLCVGCVLQINSNNTLEEKLNAAEAQVKADERNDKNEFELDEGDALDIVLESSDEKSWLSPQKTKSFEDGAVQVVPTPGGRVLTNTVSV